MRVTRRSLLKAALGTGAATAIPLGSISPAWALGLLPQTLASFQLFVNSPFRFTSGGRTATMTLTGVSDDRAAFKQRAGVHGECFSLAFTGPKGAFPQATCTVDHAAFGRFSMLIVPGAATSANQTYRAVYNRLVD